MLMLRRDLLVTLILAALFICLGSLRVMLIKFSENEEGRYDYLPVSVNVCSEFIKLVVCSTLAVRVVLNEYKCGKGLLCWSREDVLDFMKWSIPGLLYFFDNLIAFYTMEYFNPAVVLLLGNFYIITTSLLFRLILKRRLSNVQWTSIAILFLSIMILSIQSSPVVHVDHHKSHHAIQALPASTTSTTSTNSTHNDCTHLHVSNTTVVHKHTATPVVHKFNFHEGHVLVLFQCLISSTANVYNEKIFKDNGGLEQSIYAQNTKLYLFGLIFNGLTLAIHNGFRERVLKCGLFNGHNLFSLSLILITALYGLTVAFIFKFRDNMFHVLSTQLTTVLVITASIYYFGFKPSLEFFMAAPIVLLSIYVFNVSKVKSGHDVDLDVGRDRQDLVYRPHAQYPDEDRPLVPMIDQNED